MHPVPLSHFVTSSVALIGMVWNGINGIGIKSMQAIDNGYKKEMLFHLNLK